MRDCAAGAGADIHMAYLNRWHPAFRALLERFSQGDLGTVLFQNSRLSNSMAVPLQSLSWAKHSSPGWFLMPHTVDIVAALAPRGRTVVHGVGRRGLLSSRGVDTWDGMEALLEFSDGSVASLESLWVLPDHMPSPVRFGYEATGDKSSVVIEDSRQGMEVYSPDGTEFPRSLVANYSDLPMGPNVTMFDAFVQSLRDGQRRLPGADEAAWVTQIIEAIHLAAKERSIVTVDPLK